MCVARHSHDWMVYDTFREWSHFEVYENENTNLLCVGIKKTRSFERKKINRWKPKPIRAHSILCAVPIRFFFAATTFISFLICVAAGVCAFRSLRALSNCILCVGVFTFLFKFIRTLSCPVITIASFTCQETVYALYGILLHISVLFPVFFLACSRHHYSRCEKVYRVNTAKAINRRTLIHVYCVMCLTLESMPWDIFFDRH